MAALDQLIAEGWVNAEARKRLSGYGRSTVQFLYTKNFKCGGDIKGQTYKSVLTTQNDALIQDAVARWMRTDGFQRHLNRTRRTYDKRLQGAVSTLEHYQSLGLPISWRVPDGGMALWLKTPWNTEQLLEAATREGIMIQSEGLTRIDGRPGNHLRLGFARHTVEEQADGLEKLFHLGKKLRHETGRCLRWFLDRGALIFPHYPRNDGK